MFYDIFKELCDIKGVTPNKACLEMGLSRSVAAKWKNTQTNPSADVTQKIAAYFGLTADYLLNVKADMEPWDRIAVENEILKGQLKKEATPKDDLSPLDAQLMDLLSLLTDDQKRMLLAQIKTLLASQK